jgi:ferredoxin--NADP+ reductase
MVRRNTLGLISHFGGILMFEILERQDMANGTVVLNEISAPLIARKARPGQFVILKANETGERIPLTMADTDPNKGTITIIYQIVGKSTALFKSLKVGERFQDVIRILYPSNHLCRCRLRLGYGSYSIA